MKYLMMVQGTQADYEAMAGKASAHSPALSKEEVQAMYAFMQGVNNDLAESGEMVDGNGLGEPAQTLPQSLEGMGGPPPSRRAATGSR